MDHTTTTLMTMPRFHLRRLARRDLPHVLRFAQQLSPLSSLTPQLPVLIQSRETVGVIAEARNCIVGFAICAIVRQSDYNRAGGVRSLLQLFHELVHKVVSRPLQVDLLQVAAASEWRDCGVEGKLLQKLDQELRQSGTSIKITVPETHLPAQLFLHDAGYRATQVLRDYYASEDAYLFESE